MCVCVCVCVCMCVQTANMSNTHRLHDEANPTFLFFSPQLPRSKFQTPESPINRAWPSLFPLASLCGEIKRERGTERERERERERRKNASTCAFSISRCWPGIPFMYNVKLLTVSEYREKSNYRPGEKKGLWERERERGH